MSATINLSELDQALFGRVKTLELNETKYQLKIDHLPNNTLVLKDPLERKVYNALLEVANRPGHVLVFLPGLSEIRRCEEIIQNNFDCEVVILHSEVSGVSIDEKFSDLGKKKIILSKH
jgi:ATP-dependent helicase HrpB